MPFQWPYTSKGKVKLAMPGSFKTTPEAKTIVDTVFADLDRISKYELYNRLVFVDDDLMNAINRISQMVRFSYQGVAIHAGKELDPREKKLLASCRNFERIMNLQQLFFSISQRMIQDGDLVCLKWKDNGKLKGILALPMTDLTAVDNVNQINKTSDDNGKVIVVQNPKLYLLNEPDDTYRKSYNKEDVVVFSMNNFAWKLQDNVKRWTYGVWSLSPLESLKAKMLWKLSTMVNDMLWRKRNLPKLHWQIDLSAFEPDQYPGTTIAEKQQAAKTAATTEIGEFSNTLRQGEVDEGIITDQSTKASYLEPRSTRYASPNELMNNLIEGIFRSIGVPEAALKGSYASQIIASSYSIIAAEMIADIIKKPMLDLLEEYLATENFTHDDLYTDEGLRICDIKIRLILPAFREENMRIAAVMAATDAFTFDEIRDQVGFEALTDEQIDRLLDIMKKRGRSPGSRTADDMAAAFITQRDRENQPDTPQSERERRTI